MNHRWGGWEPIGPWGGSVPVLLFPVLYLVFAFVQEFYFIVFALVLHFMLQQGDVLVAVDYAFLVGDGRYLVALGI